MGGGRQKIEDIIKITAWLEKKLFDLFGPNLELMEPVHIKCLELLSKVEVEGKPKGPQRCAKADHDCLILETCKTFESGLAERRERARQQSREGSTTAPRDEL